MHLLEFRIMVVERVIENMHSTGLRGHCIRQLNSTIFHGYGCTAAEQNNKRHDFNVDMSVNFKSTTVFVCIGEIRIKIGLHESRILSGKFTAAKEYVIYGNFMAKL